MPSLPFVQVLITALLPLFSTVFAGAARQDRAPSWLNEFISFVTPLGAGILNTVASGATTNASGLLFFAVSALVANLSHVPFLYSIQQQLQSRLLSFGVKPAQVQQLERDIAPVLKQSLDNLATVVGSHGGAIGKLATMLDAHMGALREIVGYIRQATPPTAIGQVPTVQDGLRALAGPAPSATSTPFSPMPPITTAAPTSVPQQPFPAPSLHWPGDTGVMAAQPK